MLLDLATRRCVRGPHAFLEGALLMMQTLHVPIATYEPSTESVRATPSATPVPDRDAALSVVDPSDALAAQDMAQIRLRRSKLLCPNRRSISAPFSDVQRSRWPGAG